MTSTVGDKVHFDLTWNVFNTARNTTHDVSPKYDTTIIGLAEGPLAFHAPERMFLREFRIQPIADYNLNMDWNTIELRVGTDIIVHHRIEDGDVGDQNDVKVFFLSGVPTVPATARIWIRTIGGPAANPQDGNTYSATLWGQWIR